MIYLKQDPFVEVLFRLAKGRGVSMLTDDDPVLELFGCQSQTRLIVRLGEAFGLMPSSSEKLVVMELLNIDNAPEDLQQRRQKLSVMLGLDGALHSTTPYERRGYATLAHHLKVLKRIEELARPTKPETPTEELKRLRRRVAELEALIGDREPSPPSE